MELVSVILVQMLHGLSWGMSIALVAVGLSLVFGMLGVVNFAHGEFYMLGAYFLYSLMHLTNSFWISLCLSVLVVTLLGILVETFLFRPLYGRDSIFHLLLTFGLAMVLREGTRLIWGGTTLRVSVPVQGAIDFFGMVYPSYRLFMLGVTSLILMVLLYVLNKTEIGATIRAAAYDQQMVRALGVNVKRLYTLVFATGSALAALSGALLSPICFVYPTMGLDVILTAFIVVIVGGTGSVFGAIIAALLIGEAEALFALVLSPSWGKILVFAVLIVSLLFKPDGLFSKTGQREG